MQPTIKSVAAAAGVSTATVSYVLSGRVGKDGRRSDSGVAPDTVRKVKEAAERLGYRPNQSARATRTGRTNLLLLSLTMLSDPWSLDVTRAVGKAARERGITPMVLADTDWRVALERQNSDVLFIDGMVDEEDLKVLEAGSRHTRIVVFSDTMEPGNFDVVRSTAGSSCLEAARNLVRGHSRVGCLSSSSSTLEQETVRDGAYRKALEEAGRPYREELVVRFGLDRQDAFRAATSLLSRKDRPGAVYVTTDFAAIEAIHAARHLGLRVPEDVEILGIGNTTDGARMSPSLTSVGPVGFFDLLADFLLARVEDPATPIEVFEFPWNVNYRESARQH